MPEVLIYFKAMHLNVKLDVELKLDESNGQNNNGDPSAHSGNFRLPGPYT